MWRRDFDCQQQLKRPYVLLEDRLSAQSPATLFTDPIDVVCCWAPELIPQAFAKIEAGIARGLHAAGFASYELGYALEERLLPLLRHRRELPLLWFGLFERPINLAGDTIDTTFRSFGPPSPITAIEYGLDRERYRMRILRLLDYIEQGDVYQVNFTFPIHFRYDGHPLALYSALRAHQPVAHGGVVALNEAAIISVSPELFLEVQGLQATTRPMKGTVARGLNRDSDHAAIVDLAADEKQRAENLMIVDLLRNDLSRISEIGSVEVPRLFEVETYPTLHTLTSTVTATLRQNINLEDTFRAMFPCGSVTGAPKQRAMEIIRELEDAPRDIYTGSIGAIEPDGKLKFNVAIRTAVLTSNGSGCYGVGGGIVADSKPDSEYDECMLKARILTNLAQDYELLETFRWSIKCGFVRLPMHLDRLAASAMQLGFSFARTDIEERLENIAASFEHWLNDHRVRLKLNRSGDVEIKSEALTDKALGPMLVGIAVDRTDRADPFLLHKTTRRQHYDSAFGRAVKLGLDEVLFLNRDGQITEGSRTNIFIESGDKLLTPVVSCGLLPGILRQTLLRDGEAVEQNLTMDDIRRAPRWYVGNSLRGLRPALLKEVEL